MKAYSLRHHLLALRDAGISTPDLVADPYDGFVHVKGCAEAPPDAIDFLDGPERSLVYAIARHGSCLDCTATLDAAAFQAYRWVYLLDRVVEHAEAFADLATRFLNGNELRRFSFAQQRTLLDTMETYAETHQGISKYREPQFFVLPEDDSAFGEYVQEVADDLTRQWDRMTAHRPAHAYALRGLSRLPEPQLQLVAAWSHPGVRADSRYAAMGVAEGLQAEADVVASSGQWQLIAWDSRLQDHVSGTTLPAGDYTSTELEHALHLYAGDPDSEPFSELLAAVHAAHA